MRAGVRTGILAAVATLVCVPTARTGLADAPGRVRGRVVLAAPGATLRDAGPIVVYLEPLDVPGGPTRPVVAPKIRQRNARFTPGFLAVAAGQTVEMPNDDAIYHNVFSYSKPNEFDLGLYRAGESRSVTLHHPGVVKFYCSIHENMSGTIFVAPSRHFATVSPAGAFELGDVAAGRYRLRTWCERLPEVSREVRVRGGTTLEVEIRVGEPTPAR